MFCEPFTPISQPNNIRIEGKMMLRSEKETLDSWYSSKFYEFLRPSIFQCLPSFLKMWNDHFLSCLQSCVGNTHSICRIQCEVRLGWLVSQDIRQDAARQVSFWQQRQAHRRVRGGRLPRSVLWYLSRKTVEKGNLLGAWCRPEYHFYHL